jgi:hypothetical protein
MSFTVIFQKYTDAYVPYMRHAAYFTWLTSPKAFPLAPPFPKKFVHDRVHVGEFT